MAERGNGGGAAPVLDVADLDVSFPAEDGLVEAVREFSLTVGRGEAVGLIGESGCGKSAATQAILGLLPAAARTRAAHIIVRGDGEPVDVAALDPGGEAMRALRGGTIGAVFQDPAASVSPTLRIGHQLGEVIALDSRMDAGATRAAAVDMLALVGMPDPEAQYGAYLHQLSGGLVQRATIALALCRRPMLLIADEPTTALDTIREAQILELIRDLQLRLGLGVLHVSHDLGLVARACDRVAVMYLGRVVECGPVSALMSHPRHPYTVALVAARPRLGDESPGRAIAGGVPRPVGLPDRCAFLDRCPDADGVSCEGARPQLLEVAPGHHVRCHLHGATGAGESARA